MLITAPGPDSQGLLPLTLAETLDFKGKKNVYIAFAFKQHWGNKAYGVCDFWNWAARRLTVA